MLTIKKYFSVTTELKGFCFYSVKHFSVAMRNELGVACGGAALTCTYADGLCAAHVQLGDATTTRS